MNRLQIIVIALLLLAWAIFMRLVDIQLVRGKSFRHLADENRYFTVHLPPERGIFWDRYHQPLVWNQRTYALATDPTAIQTSSVPIGRDQALVLMATSSTQVRFGQERKYRLPVALAHVLGYVGPVTAADLLQDSSLKVSDVVGKVGLEKEFDIQLRGRAGYEVYEINSLGQRQRLIEYEQGETGQNITTTLDPYLSWLSLQAMGEQAGAVIISDPKTGQVLTLVSSPSFDANSLSAAYLDQALEKQRQEQIQSLFTDERQVFFNRAASGNYPPGSVFKIVTALGGLEGAAVDAQTTVLDEGILQVGEYEYTNWYYTQHGRTEGELGLVRAIARSNDIFFYQVAEWLGPNQLASFARLFGLGQLTGVELGGEASGVVPDPAWKEATLGEPWYLGNTFHLGIGQGDILVTPLQIAQLTQAVANNGTMCQPSLISQAQPSCAELGIMEEYLDLVLAGLLDACSTGGTAYPLFSYNADRHLDLTPMQQINNGAVACKTGTAEFGGIDEQGYRSTHGWLTVIMGTARVRQLAAAVASGDEAALTNLTAENLDNLEPAGVELETISSQPDRLEWLRLVDEVGLPDKLVITVLVESDENNPYKEGSADAGEVVKTIMDWMQGN